MSSSASSSSAIDARRPTDRTSDDLDIIFSKLKDVKALEKFHPLLIQQLCYYSYFESLEKGVTRRYFFFSSLFSAAHYQLESLSHGRSRCKLVRHSQWKRRCLCSVGERQSSFVRWRRGKSLHHSVVEAGSHVDLHVGRRNGLRRVDPLRYTAQRHDHHRVCRDALARRTTRFQNLVGGEERKTTRRDERKSPTEFLLSREINSTSTA